MTDQCRPSEDCQTLAVWHALGIPDAQGMALMARAAIAARQDFARLGAR